MRRECTLAVLVLLLAACAAPQPPTPTPTPAASPTSPPNTPSPEPTITPSPTATITPSPTPIPGLLVIPVTSLKAGIPWLPLDTSARPAVSYLGFNTLKPPFDNALVRQAFASSVDREAIVILVNQYYPELDAHVATTLTPPETLGRDLTGQMGLLFDPERARSLLQGAGYTDPAAFPPVTIYVRPIGEYPAIPLRLAEAVAAMWREQLGVEVLVESSSISLPGRFASSPPDVYRLAWWADYNDPDNFLREIFGPESEVNYGGWGNADYLRLVDEARVERDPQLRQRLYLEAEAILCQADAAIIPLYHATYDLP